MMPGHDATLRATLAAARAAWPDVHVPDGVFRKYVAERAEDPSSLDEAAVSGLYIACGCAAGDTAALRAFERRYMPEVERAISRFRLHAQDSADVMQALREQLLVGRSGDAPRIAEYSGRGDLSGWLRVTAVRAALKKLRGKKPEVDADDALLAARSMQDDPELSYMKELYRRTFRQAFAAALASLDAREKNLLRQHVVDGLTVDELGPLYNVHRATAARWVQRAKERLLEETRKQFMARARISARECESVLRMVRSRIDVTLGRLLA
jgi:RNA polymerase sigma-70 factor (ECF subfamily)